MSTVVKFFAGAVDEAVRKELEKSQHYQETLANLKADAEYVGEVEKVAAFIGMGSISLTGLGIGYCAAGQVGICEAMVCGAVPLAFLSYNCYQASENFRTQVEEDPTKLMVIKGADAPVRVNLVVLRKCLLEKTLFFEPCVGIYAWHCLSNSLARHD